jgi:hypothetical protein
MILKSSTFWYMTPSSPLKVNGRLGGTSPPSSGLKNKPTKKLALLGLFFDPEDGGDVPPKRPLTFNGLCGIIYQKAEHSITTSVRNSNTPRK